MKLFSILVAVSFSLLFISCSAWLDEKPGQQKITSKKFNQQKFSNVSNSALYNVDNINIYQKPNDFSGKIISTKGSVHLQPFLENDDRVFRVVGSNNGYQADFVVELDNPLPKQNRIDENVQVITSGRSIRIFGIFTHVKDWLLTDGSTKKLPVLEAIAIFNQDDLNLANPLWVSVLYK